MNLLPWVSESDSHGAEAHDDDLRVVHGSCRASIGVNASYPISVTRRVSPDGTPANVV